MHQRMGTQTLQEEMCMLGRLIAHVPEARPATCRAHWPPSSPAIAAALQKGKQLLPKYGSQPIHLFLFLLW